MTAVPGSPASDCVVVGYDGSEVARDALAHAAQRAGAGGLLVVVHGYGAVPGELGHLRSEQVLEEQERQGRELLERLPEECADALAGRRQETELVAEPPADALLNVARARDASEIVVGTRGFGDARTWLGSVSHELLRIADRPVVVVPPKERIAGERPPLHAAAQHPHHRRSPRHGSPS